MESVIVTFDDVNFLKTYFNCSSDELWDAGVNLDDCNGGFIILKTATTEKWFETVTGDFECKRIEPIYDTCSSMIRFIIESMDNYCVGYSSALFKEFYIFTLHHA